MAKLNQNDSVSIIVPTYHERENIVPLVERIHKILQNHKYEIVIVDDNSNDGSEEVVASLADKYPVRILVRKNERGLSSAVVHGIKHVESEFVVVMDADLQHPPETITRMLEALQTHEMAVASRYCKGGSPGKWPLSRRIISIVANLIALPLIPKVKDRMSGFFGFRRSSVSVDELNALGWKIGLEVMVRGHYKSVAEVPYTFQPRTHGASKLSRNIIFQYLQRRLTRTIVPA